MIESGERKERLSKGEQGEMKAQDEQHWHEVAQEVLLEMRTWREDHSKATLQEIEEEVDTRIARLRAGLVEGIAMSSAAVEVGGKGAYKYRFFTPGRGRVPARGAFVVFDVPFPFAFSSSSQLKVWAVSEAR